MDGVGRIVEGKDGRSDACLLKLFQYARMQVLVHILEFECILSGLLRGSGTGIEVFELRAEAHAYFEGIGHRGVRMEGRILGENEMWKSTGSSRRLVVVSS